jgi:hypothetical protein
MQTLKSIVVGLVMCVLAVAGPAGCNDETEQELNQTFDAAMEAGTRRDADTVLRLTCPESLERYKQTLKLAWSGSGDHLRQLPTGEFMEIVWLRHVMSPEELRTATPEQALRAQVASGFYAEEDAEVRTYIRNAKKSSSGTRATADMVYESPWFNDSQRVAFSKAEKGWRIEHDSMIEAAGRSFDRVAKKVELDREQLVGYVIHAYTGDRPRRDIIDRPPSKL